MSDGDVFDRALTEFSKIAERQRRFLGVILTLSNHAPFHLPEVPDLARIEGGGDQNQRLNGVHYADWALGQFMTAARQTSWFDDTLFVFVGDHGFGIPPALTELTLLHMHVPLLFYGPGIFGDRHEVRHVVAGQLDVLPSILGIAGLQAPHQSFGRDLFRLDPIDRGHACAKQSGGSLIAWFEGGEVLIADSGKPASLYEYDFSFPPRVTVEDTSEAGDMTAHVQAFVESGIWMLKQRRAAPRVMMREGSVKK